MILQFTKMHGLGNDFVVIDGINQSVDLNPEQLRLLADRHIGVGCDQILLVEASENPQADFRYRIFNADGSEVGQCGNGARCFARFVRDQQLSNHDKMRVETQSGLMTLRINDDDSITVNMGAPRFAPEQVPLLADTVKHVYNLKLAGEEISFGAVSMGNPHAVLQVTDLASAPVLELGAQLEQHPVFPQRANIGFMQIYDRQRIGLRVFERGVGETLACGSGACAAVVVGIQQAVLDSPVKVELPLGNLNIEWQGIEEQAGSSPNRVQPVLMTGSANTVYQGNITL